jgi:hypothetical protein
MCIRSSWRNTNQWGDDIMYIRSLLAKYWPMGGWYNVYTIFIPHVCSSLCCPWRSYIHYIIFPLVNISPWRSHIHYIILPLVNISSWRSYIHYIILPLVSISPWRSYIHYIILPLVSISPWKSYIHYFILPLIT